MTVLRSYAGGRWQAPNDEGRPLRDAATGIEIARISAAGVDMSAVVDHARRVGGPALRALTFHQRAGMLKALAAHLHGHRDELYAVSAHTGAIPSDSGFDVDGGIHVLRTYADIGKREMPNDTLLVDGHVEVLSRHGRFVGQHVRTSREGVAVQINAFNFPVWGPLEKLAPAVLAGVPSIVKPASPTAFLTATLIELIIGSGILPEGSLQFVPGGVGGLFDRLDAQDSIGFTGSAATAARLRTHPCVVERGVRFAAETDSLNCSVLGPDAAPGTPEFELYVRQLAREMTIKAGQRCTVIRRALVPESFVDAVGGATRALLADVVVGNPAAAGVTMGALADLAQRDGVRRSVRSIAAVGRVVFGDPDRVEVRDADPETGAFMSPVLLLADGDRPEPHEIEPFGPVSTIIPYRTVEDVVALAARGKGSLVGSVVTADTAFARDVVLAAAPWHGRFLVLNQHDADESTGHGSPLPQLLHGGPGRAGGGEELAGLRSVMHHMQRTAIQSDPDTLTALTGTWVRGSRRRITDVHPFRKHIEELVIGDTIVAGPRTVTQEDVEHFAEFTGDTFYAHMDAEAAAANPFFGERVAHGYLVVSFAAGLFVDPAPGPVLANFGVDNLRFLTPTRFGDTLTITLTVKRISPRDRVGYGEVRWDAEVTRADGDVVARYDVLTLVATSAAPG